MPVNIGNLIGQLACRIRLLIHALGPALFLVCAHPHSRGIVLLLVGEPLEVIKREIGRNSKRNDSSNEDPPWEKTLALLLSYCLNNNAQQHCNEQPNEDVLY